MILPDGMNRIEKVLVQIEPAEFESYVLLYGMLRIHVTTARGTEIRFERHVANSHRTPDNWHSFDVELGLRAGDLDVLIAVECSGPKSYLGGSVTTALVLRRVKEEPEGGTIH